MVIRKVFMASALAMFAGFAIASSPALKYRKDALVVRDNATEPNNALVVRDGNALNILALDAQSVVRSGMNTQQALSVSDNIIKEFGSISKKNQKTISKFIEHTKKDLISLLKARKSELNNEIKNLGSPKAVPNAAEINVALQEELNRINSLIGFVRRDEINNKTELLNALLAYFSLYLAELRNSIMLQDDIERATDIAFYSKNIKRSEKALAVMNASDIVVMDRFIKKFMKKGHAVFRDKVFNNDEVKNRLKDYLSNQYPEGIPQSAISSEFIENLVIGCVYTDNYDKLTKEKQNAIPRHSILLAENIILSLNKKSAKQKLIEFFSRDKQNRSQENKVRTRGRIKNFFSSKNTDSQALVVSQGQDSVEALEKVNEPIADLESRQRTVVNNEELQAIEWVAPRGNVKSKNTDSQAFVVREVQNPVETLDQASEPIVDLESQQRTVSNNEEPQAIEWVAPRGNVKAKRDAWEKLGMISNRNSETYYSILGVSQNASASEISTAYRKLARQYHPDKNGGDKAAEQKLQKITEAYNVLKVPDQKSAYDRKLEYRQFENKYRH